MSEPGISVERRGVALIAVIDRPASKNAIARETAAQLEAIVEEASQDESVRGIVITGAGEAVFVAGGDLRDFDELSNQPMGAQQVLDMGSTMDALERCAVPVIAAVGGAALGGGCELTLSCDMVVAEEHATFSFRQAAMGLSTGWGGGTRLIERVGAMNAAQLLLLGAKVDADRALALGLVTEIVVRGGGLACALNWVDQVARLPRPSVAGLKRMLYEVRREQRNDALRKEAEVFATLWGRADHLAAMDAFLRNRK